MTLHIRGYLPGDSDLQSRARYGDRAYNQDYFSMQRHDCLSALGVQWPLVDLPLAGFLIWHSLASLQPPFFTSTTQSPLGMKPAAWSKPGTPCSLSTARRAGRGPGRANIREATWHCNHGQRSSHKTSIQGFASSPSNLRWRKASPAIQSPSERPAASAYRNPPTTINTPSIVCNFFGFESEPVCLFFATRYSRAERDRMTMATRIVGHFFV